MVQAGILLIRATRVGADASLSKIIDFIERAQMSKAPLQKVADMLWSYFVPVIIAIAVVTLVVWSAIASTGSIKLRDHVSAFQYSVQFCIAVLVIACPCALGLATPTAVMVGTGVGANHGILIKGGEPLELAHKVTTVVFDKTGTLTRKEIKVMR